MTKKNNKKKKKKINYQQIVAGFLLAIMLITYIASLLL